MTRSLFLAACSTALVLGCQTVDEPATSACATAIASPTPELGPPPPFSAEEIRQGSPPGTARTFETIQSGAPARLETVRFVEGPDAERAFIQVQVEMIGSDAEPAMIEDSATWEQLRDHAVFPPEKTSRVPAEWSTRAGNFTGWLYVVEDHKDGVSMMTRYWFAHDEPGQPVLFETVIDGETAMRSELVESIRAN